MKILLLANKFFGYADRVAKCLQDQNHMVEVAYVYQPSYLDRIKKRLYSGYDSSRIYYTNIINQYKSTHFDVIFVFGGGITQYLLESLKQYQKKSTFILYLSADIASYGFNNIYLNLFDKIFSYSLKDSEKYGFCYRPWFYSHTNDVRKTIDISFVGSIHKSRYEILSHLKEDHSINSFMFIYADILTYMHSYRQWHTLGRFIHSYGLDYNSYIEILGKSISTLDLPSSKQNNITTRPIEALGTKTKIITTNESITKYDFFNPSNIKLIDSYSDIKVLTDWLEEPYENLPNSITEQYLLKSWCDDILKGI